MGQLKADLHFGVYTLDSHLVLWRDGKRVPLAPKETQLLRLLLQHDGAVVSHETIEKEIWPRQMVSYASIARCVYELRKALADSERAIIETVSKRGYRFSLPVCRGSAPEASGSTTIKIAQARTRAYSDYIEAGRHANTGTFEGLQRAVQLLEQACRADPGFAAAYASVADCVMFQSTRGYINPAEAFISGLAWSEQALELDDQLASAWAARGWFYCVADDMAEGFENLEKSLSLDSEYARGYSYLSFAQRAAGMREESIMTARKAVELDPHSVLHRHALAWRYFCSGLQDEALEIEHRIMVDYPEDAVAHGAFGTMAAWAGIHDASLEATERAIDMSGGLPGVMTLHTYALACAGQKKQARALADGLLNESLPRAPRSHLAVTYVALGDDDRALELLAQARDEKCPWFRGARFDPRLGALATDERLKALYKGLP